MNHCIIAINDGKEYQSILCIYEGKLDETLRDYYSSATAARELVELGDINSISKNEVNAFHRDWSISWRYTKPQYYSDKYALLQYCEATGLELLFLHEDGEWQVLNFGRTFEYEHWSVRTG